ncbi:hypothetical protein JTB14_033492 [Gonioctena quinquepunctata]|nr:hypothetical protein JTB14_033492 [Gonioctena quinquepunctata]
MIWDIIYGPVDDNEAVEFFSADILGPFDLHAPLETVRIERRPAPWLTDYIRLMMKLHNEAQTKYRKYKTAKNWKEDEGLRNSVNSCLLAEKRAFSNHKSKTDPRKFWKFSRCLNIILEAADCPSNFGNADSYSKAFVNKVAPNITSHQRINSHYDNELFNGISDEFQFSVVLVGVVEEGINNI